MTQMTEKSIMRYFVNKLDNLVVEYVSKLSIDPAPKSIIGEYAAYLEEYVLALTRASHEQDGGIYVGSCGIAYALYLASKSNQNISATSRNKCINASSTRILESLRYYESRKNRHPNNDASFILGGLGAYTVDTLMKGPDVEIERIQRTFDTVIKPNFSHGGSDELFVGRAGFLCAIAVLRQHFKIEVIHDAKIVEILRIMINSGRQYARKRKNTEPPLMYAYHNTEYLGAAHGLAGILTMMLNFPQQLKEVDSQAWSDVRATIYWLIANQENDGNWAPATDEIKISRGPNELVHWCHGAPGVIHAMAAAYIAFDCDMNCLKSCEKAGELIWNKGLLQKGPGLCHGVAGNAYAFLLLYRLTNDCKWLARAHLFAKFLCVDRDFQSCMNRPDNPLSLHEGLAGAVCLLIDLETPNKAQFPLFPIIEMK